MRRSAEGKSGELIIARAADEAATICGPDLWIARIHHRGHTRAYACVGLSFFLSLFQSTFLCLSLFLSGSHGEGCDDDVTVLR